MSERKYSLWLLIGIIFIIIVFGIFFFLRFNKPAPPSSTTSESLKTHKNTKYKFTFDYPSDWILSPVEGNEDNGTFEGRTYGDVYQFSVTDNSNSNLPKKAGNLIYRVPLSDGSNSYEKAKTQTDFGCNADAPCAHASCPTVAKQNEFVTENNIKALEIYPLLEIKGCPGDVNEGTCECYTTQKEVGPIYYLDVSQISGGLLSVIEIRPELLDANRIETNPSILKSITESVKFY